MIVILIILAVLIMCQIADIQRKLEILSIAIVTDKKDKAEKEYINNNLKYN